MNKTPQEQLDELAKAALQGGIEQGARTLDSEWGHSPRTIAIRAYDIAEAMIKERAVRARGIKL